MTISSLIANLRDRDVQIRDDGGRLRVNAPKGVISPELAATLRDRKAEILDYLRRAEKPVPGAGPDLVAVSRDRPLPLSFAQLRLWFLDRFEPGSAYYNVPLALRLEGPLNVTVLERCLDELSARHEALRTLFQLAGDEEPVQVFSPASAVPCPRVDLGALPPAAREAAVERLVKEEFRRPFDLAHGGVLRATLLRLGPRDHVLIHTFHHIVMDAWSVQIYFRELFALYRAFVSGAPSPLAELPLQYADFAFWQRRTLRGERLKSELAYWRDRLAGAPDLVELPSDRPRSAVQTHAGAVLDFGWPPELAAALAELGRRRGATSFMIFSAAFAAFLHRLSGQRDVVFGSPVAGRNQTQLESLIGCFANTLVLRIDLGGDPSFGELLDRARTACLGAYAHSELPFEKLVEELQPARHLSHSPMFQTMLILQNQDALAPSRELAGLKLHQLRSQTGTAAFDLTLELIPSPSLVHGTFEYSTDLFDPTTARRFLRYFETQLSAALDRPETRLSQLGWLRPAERHQVLSEWSDRRAATWQEPVHGRFEIQARRQPEAVSVVCEDGVLTYGELDRQADRLAGALRHLGGKPGDLVAISMERSPEMLVVLLGVLKAGMAYVPVDPTYPAERRAFMLADARVAMLVTGGTPLDLEPPQGCRIVRWPPPAGERPAPRPAAAAAGVDGRELAYVIYTSGSTGRPKGVAIPHAALGNFLRSMERRPGLAAADTLLAVTTLSFDIAGLELYLPLVTGARVVIVPRAVSADGERLLALLRDCRATMLQATPATWRLLLAAGWQRTRRLTVLCGGEALPPELAGQLAARGAAAWNLYGPTETTIWSLAWRVPRAAAAVSIGRPIHNTRVVLLDPAARAVAIGVAGELHLAGAGTARGYLGRPALTAERFVPDPWAADPGERLYRTGDLARFRSDGTLEFLGRADHQIKVRGFRIELGEIEAVLAEHPGVRAAAVVATERGHGDQRLAAWWVPAAEASPEVSEIRRFLQQRLPDYMVPALFSLLEELPLLPNGKVDRRSLAAAAGESAPEAGADYVAPRTPTEDLLCGIFADVLGLERVGIRDHFFALGGHSLLVTRVVSRLRSILAVELPLREMFEAPTAARLAERLDLLQAGGEAGVPRLGRAPRDGPLPLSFAQERLWIMDQLAPGSAVYNIPAGAELRGPLRWRSLARALRAIEARHESLRTTFAAAGDSVRQVISPAGGATLPRVDLAALEPARQRLETSRLAAEEASRPFDLETGPLWRTVLLRRRPDEHVLLVTLHHVIADQWSQGVFLSELAAAYEADLAGRPSLLPELAIQYADFAVWQRGWLCGDVLERQLAYWRERLRDAPAALELPADRPRPAVKAYRGGRLSVAWPRHLGDRLEAAGRRFGTTLFMTLLAAFQTFLYRLSGQRDLTVGTPIAARTREEVEPLIGFFVNTLVMRADLSAARDFEELLAQVRERTLEAYTHQHVPFEKLVDELEPGRDLSRTPLFQVMLTLQNAAVEPRRLPGLEVRALELETSTAKFDLSLGLGESRRGLEGFVIYDADLFDETTVARWLGQLRILLAAALADPGEQLDRLPLLAAGERHQLLVEWNDSLDAYPADGSTPRLIAEQAERQPAKVALIFGEHRLSYRELDRRAERVADALRARGVGPEVRVGVAMERSPEMVAGMLGILKAGGAYVPLDPGYPAERLTFMLEDAGARVLLTQGHLMAALPPFAGEIVELDPGWPGFGGPGSGGGSAARGGSAPAPEHPVYVIYTSGSTGRPKGVVVSHRSLANRLLYSAAFDLRPADRYLQRTSVSFDVSLLEIFGCLVAGGTTILPRPGAQADVDHLRDLMVRHAVSYTTLPPSLLDVFLQEGTFDDCPALRTVLPGGEALPTALAERFLDRFEAGLYNRYGPTEATIAVLSKRCRPGERGAVASLGRPIARARVVVLDRQLAPQPIGVPGELAIGGVCLARGYLGRAARTARSFVPDPHAAAAGERLYLTGDLARTRADGEVEFLGRLDHQVKIRGFRVELGEIEAALLRCPEVRAAAVVDRAATGRAATGRAATGSGAMRLVAYVVGREPGLDSSRPVAARLAEQLASSLPDYMVPAAFVELDALPLTPSGKVDRGALPQPGVEETVAGTPPRTPAEELVAELWRDLLGSETVFVDDDFFAAGGNSLLATQLVSRLRQVFGCELKLRDFFTRPTVAGAAQRVADARRSTAGFEPPPLVPVPRDRELPLSYAQRRLWFLDRLVPDNAFYNMHTALHLRGPLDPAALLSAWRDVARRHETLRTTLREVDGEPVQVIHPPPEALPLQVDLSRLASAARAAEAERIDAREARRAFDLERGTSLARFILLRLAAAEHVLSFTVHHIVSDGWSMGVFWSEVWALYRAAADGRPAPLPAPALQYADFAHWQRGWLRDEILEAELDYWKQRLAGAPEVLELPFDHPRPEIESFRGATLPLTLPASTAAGIKALSGEAGATLFMTLSAAFVTFLHHLTGRRDLLVGSPIANRHRVELEGMIGFFVNLLPLYVEVDGSAGFRRLLGRVREATLEAYDHQDLPFEQLVEELQPERDLSHNPICQVMFAFQNFRRPAPDLPELELRPLAREGPDTGTSKFDYTLYLWETRDSLAGFFEYNTDLFDATTIARLSGHFATLLAALSADADRPLHELPLLSAAEVHQVLVEWRGVAAPYPRQRCLHELVAAWAETAPGVTAVVSGRRRLTYERLDRQANKLAHELIARGVAPEVPVGLLMERSPEMVVAILGILKAGGAYVPFDPTHPRERLEMMLGETRVGALLTQKHLVDALPPSAAEVLCLDSPWPGLEAAPETAPAVRVHPDNLAYVLYTSGSTGRPKGVACPHRGVLNLLADAEARQPLAPGEACTLWTSLNFDVSVYEIFSCLTAGGTLHVVAERVRSLSAAFLDYLSSHEIAGAYLPAFMLPDLRERLDQDPRAFALRRLLVGVEPIPEPLLAAIGRHLPELHVINGYGPTETTVCATFHSVDPGKHRDGRTPVGRGVHNNAIYLLSRHLRPVPLGVAGELHVGGAGLARGYLRRGGLTAERFVPDPFGEGRLYKTGDLARHLAEGSIEFVGRIDHQMKVRGFRIEPGEVEAALLRQPAVRDAVALVRLDAGATSEDARLVAYVVPDRRSAGTRADDDVVGAWQEVYEDTYAEAPEGVDATLNFSGWESSYTGEPIAQEEMELWAETTAERILASKPRRVLEIGCGTGLLLLRVAPATDLYLGTDFSQAALDQLAREAAARRLSQVKLVRAAADDREALAGPPVDVVVVNSVIQYFPGAEYLAAVLEIAVDKVADGGRLFVGDVRSLPLLKAFCAAVELHRAAPTLTVARLEQGIRRRLMEEEELVVAPAFFTALARHLPRIRHLEMLPKRGRHHNELTQFRYDVVLHVGPGRDRPADVAAARPDPGELPWLDWRREALTPGALRRRLEQEEPELLALAGVPDARVAAPIRALELMAGAARQETVGAFQRRVRAAVAGAAAVEPEDLWALADELGYAVDFRFPDDGSEGVFDVVLRRPESPPPPLHATAAGGARRSWDAFTNDPQQGKWIRTLVPRLRVALRETLPDYMVPSAIVLLDELPVNVNGKLDRAALPAPESASAGRRSAAPRNELERRIAGVWSDTLGLPEVGREDNFFELGGHSLLAIQLVSRLAELTGVELPLRGLFQHPTVAELARAVEERRGEGDGAQAVRLPELVPDPSARYQPFPLSDLQQAYWIGAGDTFELGNMAPHLYRELELDGLDAARLERAWRRVVDSYDALRTVLLPDGRQQVLEHPPAWELEVTDLSGKAPDERREALEAIRRRMVEEGPSLDGWPLFELRLTRLEGRRYRLHMSLSLLVCDGWSMGLLMRRFVELYYDPERPLPAATIFPRDYVLATAALKDTALYRRARDYWRARLADLPPAPELPLAASPGSLRNPRFEGFMGTLEPAPWERLKERAADLGVTPTAVLCAAFAQVLATWSRHPSFTLNVLFHNRLPFHEEVSQLVGNFSTTNLLQVDAAGSTPLEALARALQDRLWDDLEHAHFTGIQVLRELRQAQGASARATMPVVFTSTLDLHRPQPDVPGRRDAAAPEEDPASAPRLASRHVQSYIQTPQVWLDQQVMEAAGTLYFSWIAVEGLFPPGLVATLFEVYRQLVERLADEDAPWRQTAAALVPADQLAVRAASNATEAPVPPTRMQDLFAEQAAQRRGELAVVAADRSLTYGELDDRSWHLAHELRRRGAVPNRLVAVVMEKGWQQVVAVLAVQRAGAAYLPVDPALPAERFQHLLRHGEVELALTQPHLDAELPWPDGVRRLHLDAGPVTGASPLPPVQTPEDLAYVIFTSGSTGLPKGVMIDHRGAVNTLLDVNRRFAVGPEDRVLALSSLSFDLSVYDVFGLLAAGGTVVVPEPEAAREPQRWLDWLTAEKVTVWNSVPALAQMLVEHVEEHDLALPASLRCMLLSGDWIPVNLPDRLRAAAPHLEVTSLGGATEASIWSIFHPIDTVDASWASIPYGRPLSNQRFHVLSDDLTPCPVWVPGELYIGGLGVARGYWRDEERTRAQFLTHPETGERLYRTGDLGRYLPDGEIEFLGREDLQVKIQGYRIELGEIEANLLQHPALKAAAVIAQGEEHGAKRLVAFGVPATGHETSADELRDFLATKLPDYMVPRTFRFLDELPLSANAKVDRAALAALETRGGASHVPPRDELELGLARIWEEILETPGVGVFDNFFDLGGHSLLAVRLMARIEQDLGADLPLAVLFEGATVDHLASVLRRSGEGPRRDVLVAIRSEGSKPPLFCAHPVGGNVGAYVELARRLGTEQPFYGLQVPDAGPEGAALATVEAMAARYLEAIRRVSPAGPYFLSGWSMGGVLAFEMARQLEAAGDPVALVAMLDAPPAGDGRPSPALDHAALVAWFARDLGGLAGRPFALAADELSGRSETASLDLLVERARQAEVLSHDVGSEQLAGFFELFRDNALALAAYRPGPYGGSVVLFQAAREGDADAPDRGWGRWAAGGAEIEEIGGDHYSMLQAPHLDGLSGRLRRRLEQASRHPIRRKTT